MASDSERPRPGGLSYLLHLRMPSVCLHRTLCSSGSSVPIYIRLGLDCGSSLARRRPKCGRSRLPERGTDTGEENEGNEREGEREPPWAVVEFS